VPAATQAPAATGEPVVEDPTPLVPVATHVATVSATPKATATAKATVVSFPTPVGTPVPVSGQRDVHDIVKEALGLTGDEDEASAVLGQAVFFSLGDDLTLTMAGGGAPVIIGGLVLSSGASGVQVFDGGDFIVVANLLKVEGQVEVQNVVVAPEAYIVLGGDGEQHFPKFHPVGRALPDAVEVIWSADLADNSYAVVTGLADEDLCLEWLGRATIQATGDEFSFSWTCVDNDASRGISARRTLSDWELRFIGTSKAGAESETSKPNRGNAGLIAGVVIAAVVVVNGVIIGGVMLKDWMCGGPAAGGQMASDDEAEGGWDDQL
jgi:hypothetical protein